MKCNSTYHSRVTLFFPPLMADRKFRFTVTAKHLTCIVESAFSFGHFSSLASELNWEAGCVKTMAAASVESYCYGWKILEWKYQQINLKIILMCLAVETRSHLHFKRIVTPFSHRRHQVYLVVEKLIRILIKKLALACLSKC